MTYFHIKIAEARNLMAVDASGTSDPYVRLKWGWGYKQKFGDRRRQIGQTKCITKNLNPVWEGQDEELFLVDATDCRGTNSFFVDVWDRNIVGVDVFLGRVVLKMADFDPSNVSDEWYSLQAREDRKTGKPREPIEHGEVHLVVLRSDSKELSIMERNLFSGGPGHQFGLCRSRSMMARRQSQGRNYFMAMNDHDGQDESDEDDEGAVTITTHAPLSQPSTSQRTQLEPHSSNINDSHMNIKVEDRENDDESKIKRERNVRWSSKKSKNDQETKEINSGHVSVLRRAETVLGIAKGHVGRMFSIDEDVRRGQGVAGGLVRPRKATIDVENLDRAIENSMPPWLAYDLLIIFLIAFFVYKLYF